MADFEDAAKLESDKLCRRLVENAAMEAQDRRASLEASYGGALKKAKQEAEAAKQPAKRPARWEDVDLAPDEEDAVKDVPETEAEIAAKARLRAALRTALRAGQAVVRIRSTLERRAAFAAPYAGAAKTAKQEGSAASPARGSAASPAKVASPAKAASSAKAASAAKVAPPAKATASLRPPMAVANSLGSASKTALPNIIAAAPAVTNTLSKYGGASLAIAIDLRLSPFSCINQKCA